jgi:hypothetical protein
MIIDSLVDIGVAVVLGGQLNAAILARGAVVVNKLARQLPPSFMEEAMPSPWTTSQSTLILADRGQGR